MQTNISKNTLYLTQLALLAAIIFVMASIPNLGFIKLPWVSATIVHIPVIIGAILLGPAAGLFLSAEFGILSLWQAYANPQLYDIVFQNPLISVLPRLFIGLVAAYCFKGLIKIIKNNTLSALITGVIGSLTNSFFTVGAILLFARPTLEKWLGFAGKSTIGLIGKALSGIILAIGMPEAIVAAILTSAISVPLLIFLKRYKQN